jgi:hypothetical protein
LSDNDKQGATANLSAKQAVEAVVDSVLNEALSNVASVRKPSVEMVLVDSSFNQMNKHVLLSFTMKCAP